MTTTTTGYLHSVSILSSTLREAAYEVFRAACEGGGTPPQWTQCGPDPIGWHSPLDAAGGLCLWDEAGHLIRVEPRSGSEDAEAQAASDAYAGLLEAGAVVGVVVASYASSGGRMVALCRSWGNWHITVSRSSPHRRVGSTEEAIRRSDPKADILVLRLDATGDAP